MPSEVTAAGNVEKSRIATLESFGFVVTQELSGGMEEWLAIREDLHLRAESPEQLLDLYTLREHATAERPRRPS